MRSRAVMRCTVLLAVLAAVTPVVAQEVSGVEHWVEQAGLKLSVWEKYLGSPTGKPVVILAHGSATAGRESFDLQVPGQPSYSLMDVLAREGFDVFALDTRGFGRSTRPDGHMTTQEASEDLDAVVDYLLKLRGPRLVLGDAVQWDVRHGSSGEGAAVCELRPDACQQPRSRQAAAPARGLPEDALYQHPGGGLEAPVLVHDPGSSHRARGGGGLCQ